MRRKRVTERDCTVMTKIREIWLRPTDRIVISIQAISKNSYFAGVAKRGCWNEVLVGRGNRIFSAEEKGADSAISGAKGCYSRGFDEKAYY
jgi:hypothetical protein